MPVHLGRSGDAGADEVVSIIAAATQRENSFRGVDQTDKGCIGGKIEGGVGRQSVILEATARSSIIYDPISADGSGRRCNVHRNTCP